MRDYTEYDIETLIEMAEEGDEHALEVLWDLDPEAAERLQNKECF